MSENTRLKEPYGLAGCCDPQIGQTIVGYHSFDGGIKVHQSDCKNLSKPDAARLVSLEWDDILAEPEFEPGSDYKELNSIDWRVLAFHKKFGVDYSHSVARGLHLPKEETFSRHKQLKENGLLKRVEPSIIRYRKGIVDNKWIKHRNHTYYELTERGEKYLSCHNSETDNLD